VVPKPDADRGAVVKAYVVLSPDWLARRPLGVQQADFDDAVRRELQAHVKGLLAPYEYPKEIEFIDQLPMTTTGKVQRRVLRLQEQARYESSVERGAKPIHVQRLTPNAQHAKISLLRRSQRPAHE
jgi:acetyl-CoA synthetase